MRLVTTALLLIAYVAACPGSSESPGATAPDSLVVSGITVTGTLKLDSGVLRHSSGLSWATDTAWPYQVVALGPPALVTTIDGDLVPTTWAVTSSAVSQHPGWLPWIVEPPVAALVGLEEKPTGGAEGVLLLKPDGTAGWHEPTGDLLWPVQSDGPPVAYVLSAGAWAATIMPFGDGPTLTCLDASTLTPSWRTQLSTAGPVADAQLFAATGTGLLLGLQYDTELWELVVLDTARGVERSRFQLEGQPAYTAVYPGPTYEPSGVKLGGDMATALLFDRDTDGWQHWSFDLVSGERTTAPAQSPIGSRNEQRRHSAGGNMPFPQHILPTAHGVRWEIPALVNSSGAVLVITDDGAQWRHD